VFFKRTKPGIVPEWLVVGLGNPGGEYGGTRHNVGFAAIDRLAARHRIKLDRSKHRARYGLGTMGGTAVALVKPLTYMNLSGQAVGPFAREWGISPEKVLVIADDLDLGLGVVRIRRSGSAGGHNGHKSIIQHLKTQEYPRIKIGIGRGGETVDHVLSRFHPDEHDSADEAIEQASRAAEMILADGLERAMMTVNERSKQSPDSAQE
jgi:PTH1 family peptidyl-tRNA hydrolase